MTTAETRLARAFGLEGEGWQRHANPWSVYTRVPVPVLLTAAVWSRRWLGRWALLPVGLVCVWTAVNPTAFPPPRSLDNWASKAVLGEVVWSRRRTVPVPPRHRLAPWLLTGLNVAGLPALVRGLVTMDGRLVVGGLAVHMAGKLWFLDRMVWLFEDVTGGQAAGPGPGDDMAITDWP
jgi:hypothetical protein